MNIIITALLLLSFPITAQVIHIHNLGKHSQLKEFPNAKIRNHDSHLVTQQITFQDKIFRTKKLKQKVADKNFMAREAIIKDLEELPLTKMLVKHPLFSKVEIEQMKEFLYD